MGGEEVGVLPLGVPPCNDNTTRNNNSTNKNKNHHNTVSSRTTTTTSSSSFPVEGPLCVQRHIPAPNDTTTKESHSHGGGDTTTVVVLPDLKDLVLWPPSHDDTTNPANGNNYYLEWPSFLTAPQRRIVHEICLELGLYHLSVDVPEEEEHRRHHESVNPIGNDHTTTHNHGSSAVTQEEDDNVVVEQTHATGKKHPEDDTFPKGTTTTRTRTRKMYISAFVDGLDKIIQQQEASSRNDNAVVMPLYKYRPWYCRNNNNIARQTKDSHSNHVDANVANNLSHSTRIVGDTRREKAAALQAMDALMDQPGQCLRPGLDDLDYSILQYASLQDETAILGYHNEKNNSNTSDLQDSNSNNNNHETSLLVVDSPTAMQQCIQELLQARPTELAFDVEAYNRSKCTQMTCLLQLSATTTISTGTKGEPQQQQQPLQRDYVIDTLAPGVWDMVPQLAPLFADPMICKIGHAIGGLDVPSLHRDFGIFVVNAFDTYEAAKVLKLPSSGLAALCQHYHMPHMETYRALKEQYQNCNWRQRPLTAPMIQYGRYDVHYLSRLRRLLMRDLVRHNLWEQSVAAQYWEASAVASALERFRVMEEEEEMDNEDNNVEHSLEHARGGAAATIEGKVARASNVAKDDDGDDYHENDNDRIENTDKTADNRDSYRDPIATVHVLRMQADLMRVISLSQQRCRELWKNPKEVYTNHPLRVRFAEQARRKELLWTLHNEALLDKLIEWRNTVAQDLECLPGFVAPLEVLIPIALQQPTTDEGLFRISSNLPEVLDQEPKHRQSLFELIRQFQRDHPDGDSSSHFPILRVADIRQPNSRKRKRFAWSTAAVLAVGAAAGVAVAFVVARNCRRRM